MPYAYVYECPGCRFDLEIRLAQEFRRDASGQRVDFEYPHADVVDWPPKRVAGLWSYLWCPGCRAVRRRILVELEEPAEHPVQAFLAAEAKGLLGEETGPCPECGTELRTELEGEPCPVCGEAELVCVGEYEP